MNIVNRAAVGVRITVESAEFSQETDGEITFRPPGPVSAASWVTMSPSSFELGPGESRKVKVKVSVPHRPEPGERYIGILFKTPPRQTSKNVQVAGAVASQLMVNVPGKAIHKIVPEELQAPRFAFWGPIRLTLPIRNAGNIHRSYTGPKRLVATASGSRLAFPDFTVLGNSQRTLTTQWHSPPIFCVCDASVTIPTGQGKSVTRTTRIIVIPLPQIIGLLAAALGLFLLTRKGVRYQRALLAAARR
ncbi:hypothetical protein ACFXOM_04665 [Streptomyces sp. NPDC059169]|uniref:hypothetical protein n=1 Tax=Streptomyces sp. NPDC059169 TaxID=3346754 RepID=UPI003686551D